MLGKFVDIDASLGGAFKPGLLDRDDMSGWPKKGCAIGHGCVGAGVKGDARAVAWNKIVGEACPIDRPDYGRCAGWTDVSRTARLKPLNVRFLADV